jgi:glycosyltransferase involved in cell wall biosynthesis
LPEDKHVIVFGAVKIDEQRKGLKYLNQALQRLIDQEIYKKDDFHLALFGGIKQADVLDEIPVPYTYLGFLKNDEELSSLYSAADVAAIPSLYETFGQTVVEAQACGCVPVTFTGSGQMDIITHLQNGYLAEYLSVEDFAKGIQWALSRQTERIALRESAVKRYSERTIALRYIDLYNQTCKGEE